MNVKLSKVFLSFILAIAMCLSIGSVAFAADSSTSANPSDVTVNASEVVPMSVGTYTVKLKSHVNEKIYASAGWTT